jgi:hypothetical protein
LRRLGGNTGCVNRPEETIADNVAQLLANRPARNVDLLGCIKALLESRPT